ncbi:conserved repeat domain-containing protein [Halomicrobium zhouii]|uniref:Conserved repeat domain-containing protein n=1 Tax=Halomicrobium zhouii TaxID=767519 RepID=A0A1I6KD38_9EURY|nr:DUF58 domain-containing protein [Halomicrobium zhouii]SFR89064.1 conserved repeat domain-containing protein [Halomicrobium zhouii]
MSERVGRWGVALVGALTLVSVGLLAAEPFLLAATAVPLAYVLYGAVARVPPGASLRAERVVETGNPTPGEAVDVALTVTNDGDAALTDVRIVDGVPGELTVVDGSPRACESLRPGDSVTVRYSLLAKRGTFAFDDPVARVRPLAATAVATATLDAAGDASVTCANVVSEVPLADATLPRAGTLPTDSGGSGLEFHATRNYQSGDPVSRIDWRRFAKTNELTTVQYREEQAVRTVLVVDARPVTRVTPDAGYPTGAELGAYAAERLFDALGRTSVVASVVAVGLDADDVVGGLDPDDLVWVDPGGDGGTAARVSQVFDGIQAAVARGERSEARGTSERGAERPASRRESGTEAEASARTDPETDSPPSPETDDETVPAADGGEAPHVDESARRLLARLPPTAQVVLFSPFVDDWPVTLTQSLAARGYPTTVVSPDVTHGGGLGQSVVGLERDLRIQSVELAGATCIDWDLDEPIDIALRASLADLFKA